MASTRSPGRSGAMPLAAISLAGEAPATSFCTTGGSASGGSGAGTSSDAVSFMKDLQPAQGEELVAILDRARLASHQRGQPAGGHDVRVEADLGPDAGDQRVDQPGVA